MGEPDVQDYAIAQTERGEVVPGPNWQHLYRWLFAQAHEILAFDSVYVITYNRDLASSDATSQSGLTHCDDNQRFESYRFHHCRHGRSNTVK